MIHQLRAISTVKIFILLCPLVFGSALGAELANVPPVADTASHHVPSKTFRAPLDLKAPPLSHVMSHSQLLAAMGASSDEEAIEVVAAPELMPMSSDVQAPLGVVDALQWSVYHPTQAWRILLPAVGP